MDNEEMDEQLKIVRSQIQRKINKLSSELIHLYSWEYYHLLYQLVKNGDVPVEVLAKRIKKRVPNIYKIVADFERRENAQQQDQQEDTG